MNIIMNNIHMKSVEEVKNFLVGVQNKTCTITTRQGKYECVRDTLIGLRYTTLCKKDKGVVKVFLSKVTGYEEKQLKRLISTWKKDGLRYTKRSPVGASVKTYTATDIDLLIATDILHKTPNGRSTKETLKREFITFGKEHYATIAGISVSHIYNIRKTIRYRSSDALLYTKTTVTPVNIGERRKPDPRGVPGFVRVDSVHQGDRDGVKGVYHINMVDEVTQWEVVGCVPHISDEYMIPLLHSMMEQFPFVIWNFHSDNGSEYINRTVAEMLNNLVIKQTKSRSRKTNDQALVESKNGSVIRKHMGRNHIVKDNTTGIDTWYTQYFNVYLNYHRISAFATDYTDTRGKVRKTYDQYMTPYEKLKLVENAYTYLKPDFTFALLDKLAYAESDNDFAQTMQKAKELMEKHYKKISKNRLV